MMFHHKTVLTCIAIQILCCVNSQRRFDCVEDFCSKIECGKGKEGRAYKNASRCGCCDVNVIPLKEGEPCITKYIGELPKAECGRHLKCDKELRKCVPVKTQCVERMEKSYNLSSHVPVEITQPQCDEYGFYESVICLTDVLCYCVDKTGSRIFGTEVASKENATQCQCSREFVEFPRNIPEGNYLRCLPNGEFDELQCTENSCYCMQNGNLGPMDIVETNTSLKELSCYNDALHSNVDTSLRSECWRERFRLKQLIKQHEDENITVVGVDLPNCDLDGSYAPVQCKKDSCYCVNKKGKILNSRAPSYEDYKVPRYSQYAKEMNCNCARDKDLIHEVSNKNEEMELFLMYDCHRNGNYKTHDVIQ